MVIFEEDLICLDLSSDMATVLVTICFMSRYFINLCYLAQMVLNILLPWRWLGMLQVTWSLRCLNLCVLLKLFIPFPLGPYFLLMLFTLYIYIYIYFTCLPHGSPFYNFLKVGSSLFGLFSIYTQEQVIIHTLFFRSLNPCYLLLPRLLASIIIYVFIGLKEP